MLLYDKKKTLSQILGPHPEHKAEGGEVHDHAHHLAKEAVEAVHAKDHKGFADAMHAMHMHFNSLKDPDDDGDIHDEVTGREE